MTRWEKIETANLKEMEFSRPFLVSDGHKVWVATVWFDGCKFEFTDELSNDHELYGKDAIREHLTHWMPLPSPPESV